jgi:Vacuolar-sorting-associated 13 protein C-terminal
MPSNSVIVVYRCSNVECLLCLHEHNNRSPVSAAAAVVAVPPHSTAAIDVDPFLMGDTIELQLLIRHGKQQQVVLLHTVTLPSQLLRESCEPHWLPVHPLLFSLPLLSPLVMLAARGSQSSSSTTSSNSGSSSVLPDMTLCLHVYSGVSMRNHTDRALTASVSVIPVHLTAAAAAAAVTQTDVSLSKVTEPLLFEGSPIEVLCDVAPRGKTELLTSLPAQCNANHDNGVETGNNSNSSSSGSNSTVAYSPDVQSRLQFTDSVDVIGDVANCFNLNFEEPFCTRALLPCTLQSQCEADTVNSSIAPVAAAAPVVLPVVVYTTADDIQGGVELTTVHIQPRLVLQNTTPLALRIGLQHTDKSSMTDGSSAIKAQQQQQQLGVLTAGDSMQLVVAAPARQQQSQHSDPFSVSKIPLLTTSTAAALAAAEAIKTCITISGSDDVSCHVDSSNSQLQLTEVDGSIQCSSAFVKVVVCDNSSSSSSSGTSSTRAVMLRVLHSTDEHGVHTVTLQLDPHPSLMVYNRSQQALVVAVSDTALLQLPANSSFELPRPSTTAATDSATAATDQRNNSSTATTIDAPPTVSGSRTAAQKSGKVLEHKYKLRLASSINAATSLQGSSDDNSAVYCAEQWLAAGIQHIILHRHSTAVHSDAVVAEHAQLQQQQVMLQVHVFDSSGSTVMSIRDTTLHSADAENADSSTTVKHNSESTTLQQQQLQQLQAVFTGVTVVLLDDAVLTSAPRGTSLACALTPVARLAIGSLHIRHTVCPHNNTSNSDNSEVVLQSERLADSTGHSRSECAFSDTTVTAYTAAGSTHPNSTHVLFRFRPNNSNSRSSSSSDVASGFLASVVRVLPVAGSSSVTRYEAVAVQCAAIEVHYDESVVLPLLAFLRTLHAAAVDNDSSSSSAERSATSSAVTPTEVYIGYLSLGTVPVSLTFIGRIKQVSVSAHCVSSGTICMCSSLIRERDSCAPPCHALHVTHTVLIMRFDASATAANTCAYRAAYNTPACLLLTYTIICSVSHHCFMQAFVALEATPLQFNGLNLRNVLDAPAAVTHFVFANYTADTLLRSPAVLGSLMAIGNPTALINEWCKGLHDLVILPLWAIPEVCNGLYCDNFSVHTSLYLYVVLQACLRRCNGFSSCCKPLSHTVKYT